MRKLLVTILSLMTVMTFAQNPVELPLWADGAPNSNGLIGDEQEVAPNRISNVTKPTITVYQASQPTGMAIIMCPGGGYSRLAMDHEGHDMAPWFVGQGITYIVLKYRMPNAHCEVPLSDVQQAMRMVRSHAKEWNIDPHKIGIMGASAGGHLASTLATHYDASTRPDFQILLYPVVTMHDNTHQGSKKSLLGKQPTAEQVEYYSNELQVTPDTPQAFIALSSDDKAVPPSNGVNYYLALQKNNVSASLHVYPTGGHGWGYRDSFKYKLQWTKELEKWLNEGIVFSDKEPMLRVGKSYIGTKFEAHTLDHSNDEKLVINTQAVDCITFVEYTLAQALGSTFADNLKKIRYRNGVINGYTSRLHYTSEWIENGIQLGFLEDITAYNCKQTTKLSFSYMSSNVEQYKQLASSSDNLKLIIEKEKALSGKKIHWLPKKNLPDVGLPWIMNGDIIAITTNRRGLDIAHVGIACYSNGKLNLLHASASVGKVLISEKPISEMLKDNKFWTGIRVIRMSNPKNN